MPGKFDFQKTFCVPSPGTIAGNEETTSRRAGLFDFQGCESAGEMFRTLQADLGSDPIQGEEAWRYFRDVLDDAGMVSNDDEARALEAVWDNSVAESRWHHGQQTVPSLGWAALPGMLLFETKQTVVEKCKMV